MARRPGNAGVHTGTAPRSGARERTSQFRDGLCLGTYPTRQSGTPARERRPPVGTARERETSADAAARCQLEFRTLFQSRTPRPLTAPPNRGRAFFMPGGRYGRTPIMMVSPGGGSFPTPYRADTATGRSQTYSKSMTSFGSLPRQTRIA